MWYILIYLRARVYIYIYVLPMDVYTYIRLHACVRNTRKFVNGCYTRVIIFTLWNCRSVHSSTILLLFLLFLFLSSLHVLTLARLVFAIYVSNFYETCDGFFLRVVKNERLFLLLFFFFFLFYTITRYWEISRFNYHDNESARRVGPTLICAFTCENSRITSQIESGPTITDPQDNRLLLVRITRRCRPRLTTRRDWASIRPTR